MALDNQRPISDKFNIESSLVDIEKKLAQVQLTTEAEKKLFRLRLECTKKIKEKERAFNDTKEHERRIQEKEIELVKSKSINESRFWEKIKDDAKFYVKSEHEKEIKDIYDEYAKEANILIEQAKEQERLKAAVEKVAKQIEKNRNNALSKDRGEER